MKVIVSGKGMRLTERLREFATERLSAVQKFYDHINEVDLVLSADKHKTSENTRHAEVVAWASGSSFKAKCVSNDFYAAVSGAADKIESQLRRYKEKLKENRHKRGPTPPVAEQREMTQSVVKLQEGEGKKPRIVRSNSFAAKPMSIEEAADQLKTLEQDFVVFSNAETGEVNVVYRRADGNIGLIEPTFK